MTDLSVIIPARNEQFLARTIEDILAHRTADTEIIAILDGYWPDPPIHDHPAVQLIHHSESIGQRAAVNEGARISRARYIMKADAHCSFDKGFDTKLMADCEPDWTVIPKMYNLHAFDWVCGKCGHQTYQGPKPETCVKCEQPAGFEKKIIWRRRLKRHTEFWRFDKNLKFQYWHAYNKRPAAKADIADTMSSIGACFFMERTRFWDIDGMDEDHGGWGQMGTELACKSWLSGGRQVVNKKTWFAHMFRTNNKGFSFPYPLSGGHVKKARAHSRKLWLDHTWPKAIHKLDWLVEKFAPVPDWHPGETTPDKLEDGKAPAVSGNYWYNNVGPGKKYSFEQYKKRLNKVPSRRTTLQFVQQNKPAMILDIGCGLGGDVQMYQTNDVTSKYHGIDSCAGFIKYNKKHFPAAEFQVAEIDKIPYPDDYFDLVTCRAVLEHIKDPISAIAEMARKSKKYIIITWYRIPAKKEEINYDAENKLYRNTYRRKDMLTAFKNVGFAKTKVEKAKDKTERHETWIMEKTPVQAKETIDMQIPELSVIIPARNEKYLQATVDDLIKNLKTKEYEIIVGLDNYEPEPILQNRPRLRIHKVDKRIGMRPMINQLVALARGRYIMKTDAHCAFAGGYDRALIDIHRKGDTVLGIRYELDVATWQRRERTDCDFRYLSHPDKDPKGGLRGLAWDEYKKRTTGRKVAESMSLSGSGWLMEKAQFDAWGGLDENHGTFGQEGAEIACKTWLSGGRLRINRETWYAHWNRGKAPYALSTTHRQKSIDYSIELWLNDKWPLQKYSFNWLIERFAPVPGWEIEDKGLAARRQGTLFKSAGNLSVAALWDLRIGIAEPLKRWRIKIFYDAFSDMIDMVKAGHEFSDDEIRQNRYYQYLLSHVAKITLPQDRQKWEKKYGKRLLRKFKSGIDLYKSIAQNGLYAPLEFYAKDERLYLWKGYRRLVVLQALGIKKVPVVMWKNERCKKLAPRFRPTKKEPVSIEELARIQFAEHGARATDKYWVHQYTPIYDEAFKYMRNRKINILELGVLRGASLKLWHDAFPRAQIYGLDKNKSTWREFTQDLDRVQVFVGRQEDTDFLDEVIKICGGFDIVVDDCGHQPGQQWAAFEQLWPAVKRHGIYVIEDTFRSFLPQNNGDVNMVSRVADMVSGIYSDQSIAALQFHYNMCVVQKGITT